MADYLIGVDGGGTSCRAVLADRAGAILGQGQSGAANILTDPQSSLRHIEEAALIAFSEARLEPRLGEACAVLGLAGTNVGEAADHVLQRLPFRQSRIVSDAAIALQGAIGDGDGAIGIIGTGTIFLMRCGGTVRSIGGWGFSVSDIGGGARLGRSALEESLLAFDGIRPASPCALSILEEFDGDPKALAEFARLAKPGDFGRFAPRLFEFAREGDEMALRLVKTGAADLDAAFDAVASGLTFGDRLCLVGGLAGPYRPYLGSRHQARLSEPLASPLLGALALAAKAFS